MDKKKYHYEYLNDDHSAQFYTFSVVCLNVCYAALGALIISASLFLLLSENFSLYLDEFELKKYKTGVYLLMAAGFLVMVQAFFGICGAFMKIRRLLHVFLLITVICFALEVAGSALLLSNGITNTKTEIEIENRIYDLLANYNDNEEARRSLDFIQKTTGCCGAIGVSDYIRWNMVVPSSCYDPITGNAWHSDRLGFTGCVIGVTRILEKGTGWICAFSLILAFLQIFGGLATILLIRIKEDFKSMHDINGK